MQKDAMLTDHPATNWRTLALAVVLRAVLDARKGDAGALTWLTGEDGRAWAEPLDLPYWPPPDLDTPAGTWPKRALHR